MSSITYTENLARKCKVASKQVAAKANTTDGDFYMLVDLDNANGGWKHSVPTVTPYGIRIFAVHSAVGSVTAADLYRIDLGIVLDVGASHGDLAIVSLSPGMTTFLPFYLDCTVEDNALRNMYAAALAVDDTEVQSDVNLVDPGGSNVLPEVGDLLFRVISTKTSPAGNVAIGGVTVWYDVVSSR
jgi:hypothetical protein